MTANPLQRVHEAGQAVWMDYLERALIVGGELERMVAEDALTGITSNPTIFGKAIGGSDDYDEAIRDAARDVGGEPVDVFYEIALDDIRGACDVLRGVYDDSGGRRGFVSFELEARLARDTAGSIEAAKELFARIDRPNAMIKVPGTVEGVPAVRELIAAGVNVNITLLFAVDRYEEVARAYVDGLEQRLRDGRPLDRVASVASFFLSRVDDAVDGRLPADSSLRGRTAIANAKVAYRSFREIFSGERWGRLAEAGAGVQRPLWASTAPKDPAYRDTMYVEELVGPDTVNTMKPETIDAVRDHGEIRPGAVTEDLEGADATRSGLAEHGIDLDAVTSELVDAGIESFDADFRKLLGVIEGKLAEVPTA